MAEDIDMDIFRLVSVRAGYGKDIILDDISLSISKGDFISVIGPNGAGKSTLVKVLSGDLTPFQGSVDFKGVPLENYSRKRHAMDISIVHQFSENLLPFKVYDFVRMGRFPYQKVWELETDADRDIIDNAMEETGIKNLRGRSLTELSGGELQLAFIAKALAQNREIIILDEPISHLDLRHSIDIMDILYNLNVNGSTIISVLHDINISSDYSNRIIALKEGKLFFDGTPEEVIKYEKIEELFDIVSIVRDNPISGRPYIYPVPVHVQKPDSSR